MPLTGQWCLAGRDHADRLITYHIARIRHHRALKAAAGQDVPLFPLWTCEDGNASEVPFVHLYLTETEGYYVDPAHVDTILKLRASGASSQADWVWAIEGVCESRDVSCTRQATRWCW
jgi:hypothetical protein